MRPDPIPGPPLAEPSSLHTVELTVNDRDVVAQVEARLLLSDFLRQRLGLTGTHVGCEHGVCGACTVLLDGEPVRSCLVFAAQCGGHRVRTVEGLAGDEHELGPAQRGFHDCHGMQCGFCTSGLLMSTTRLLDDAERPTADHVEDVLAGHLCRCTGYRGIRLAVQQALDERYGVNDG